MTFMSCTDNMCLASISALNLKIYSKIITLSQVCVIVCFSTVCGDAAELIVKKNSEAFCLC